VAPKFVGAVTVARARSRLGEDQYRFWSNNCEHFSEWCITGTGRSLQVEAWQRRMGRRLSALGSLCGLPRRKSNLANRADTASGQLISAEI
jgi:hypothetical protein